MAIISDRHILTAAECVDNSQAAILTVVFGGNQRKPVRKINYHYLYSDKKNNLAILELEDALTFSNLVKPIAFNNPFDLDNEEVVALGVIKVLNSVS